VSDGSNNRLSSRVDMDVLDNDPLLSATTTCEAKAFVRRATVSAFEACLRGG
jgi:hypothetical protein